MAEQVAYGQWVKLDVTDGVATIRIDRPKMNPLDAEIQDSLARVAADLLDDADVRAASITVADQVFAAGADIKEMQQGD